MITYFDGIKETFTEKDIQVFHLSKHNDECFHELKRLGYDLDRIAVRVAVRVAEIFQMEADDIFLKGKQQRRVKARSLFCFWAFYELGISLTELARRIGISVTAIGYSVERGKIIANENNFRLTE